MLDRIAARKEATSKSSSMAGGWRHKLAQPKHVRLTSKTHPIDGSLQRDDICEKLMAVGLFGNQKRSSAPDRPLAASIPRAVAQCRIRGRKATRRDLAGSRRARQAPRYCVRNLSGRAIDGAI